MTSMTAVRVTCISTAAIGRARVTEGRNRRRKAVANMSGRPASTESSSRRCVTAGGSSPLPIRPDTGSRCSVTEKISISTRPSQNPGMETPTSDPTRARAGVEAERNSDQQGDDGGGEGELDRRRQTLGDHADHRPVVEEAAAEIAVEGAPQEAREPARQREVEPHLVAQRRHLLGRDALV